MSNHTTNIAIMVKAAEKAAKGIVRDYGEVENLQISQKSPGDFVSASDIRAEKIIHAELSKARPDYGFLMEESGEIAGSSDYRWIIDPIDGTTNFIHSNPYFCINIALEQKIGNKSEIIAGITYAPISKELFWAERGKGAWLEFEHGRGRRLRVASRTKLSECLLAISSYKKSQKLIHNLSQKVSATRIIGSAALDLAYLAAGRVDIYAQQGVHPWDIASGIILVKEAGGIVKDLNKGDKMLLTGDLLASNADLYSIAQKDVLV